MSQLNSFVYALSIFKNRVAILADVNTQPFHYLKLGANGGITSNANIKGTAASSYQLFLAIGVVGLLVTIIVAALKLASSPASKRAEVWEEMQVKVIIGIVLFSIPTIISFMMRFATAFV